MAVQLNTYQQQLALRYLIVRDPTDRQSLENLVRHLRNLGRFELGLKYSQWLKYHSPLDEDCWLESGIIQSVKQNNEDAIFSFRIALILAPENAKAFTRLVLEYISMSAFDAARDLLNRIGKIYPTAFGDRVFHDFRRFIRARSGVEDNGELDINRAWTRGFNVSLFAQRIGAHNYRHEFLEWFLNCYQKYFHFNNRVLLPRIDCGSVQSQFGSGLLEFQHPFNAGDGNRDQVIDLRRDFRSWSFYARDGYIEGLSSGPSLDMRIAAGPRLKAPFCIDLNHQKSGPFFLFATWRPEGPPIEDMAYCTQDHLARASKLDLRDAIVELDIESHDFIANAEFLCLTCHAQTGRKTSNGTSISAPWLLTSQAPRAELLNGSKRMTLTFKLKNDETCWTFAGNNPEFRGVEAEKYAFHPLSQTLGNHDLNIFFCFWKPHEPLLPRGEISIHAMRVVHRDWSVLACERSTLISAPEQSGISAKNICNGISGMPEYQWRSQAYPTNPPTFIWDLNKAITLNCIKLYQNTDHPTQTVNILTSEDGQNFAQLGVWTLPRGRPEWDEKRETVCIPKNPPKHRFLKLILQNGHQKERWGIDLIEAYSNDTGWRPPPPVGLRRLD